MSVWIVWLIMALVMFIFEIFTPGFFAGCLGIAAAINSLLAFLFPSISIVLQIIIFSTFSLLSFIFLRPFVIKYLYKNKDENKTNVDALIGKKGKIIKPIKPSENGLMKIYGDEFIAVSEDGTPIDVGEEVEIIKLDGIKVIVKKAK